MCHPYIESAAALSDVMKFFPELQCLHWLHQNLVVQLCRPFLMPMPHSCESTLAKMCSIFRFIPYYGN